MYHILFYTVFGLYGYCRFSIILWEGRRMFLIGKIDTKILQKYEYLDLFFGLLSFILASVYIISFLIMGMKECAFILISLLYSGSLLLRSLRTRLEIVKRHVFYRKIFNYGANLNIILSALMIKGVLDILGIEKSIFWVLGLYFGTFFIIWKIKGN